MQIKVLGFEWKLAKPFDTPAMLKHLQKTFSLPFYHFGMARTIFWSKRSSLDLALLVTSKNRKTRTEYDEKTKELVAVEARSGRKQAEFNLLAVNPATSRALYTYYHGSWSLSQFQNIVETEHRKLRKEEIASRAAAGKTDSHRKKLEKEARNALPKMEWLPNLTQDGLKELIESFQQVKRFEFSVAVEKADSHWFAPLGKSVKTHAEQVSFAPTINQTNRNLVEKVAGFVPGIIKKIRPKTGRIIGSIGDLEMRIDIHENLRTFDQNDLDKAIKDMKVDPTSFANHELCDWVVGIGTGKNGWLL